MRLQCLNVISKDMKPFEKEFYNSFNLTNLSREGVGGYWNLQLNEGNCPGDNWHKGSCPGDNCPRAIDTGGDCLRAIDTGGDCPGGDCLGSNWHGG